MKNLALLTLLAPLSILAACHSAHKDGSHDGIHEAKKNQQVIDAAANFCAAWTKTAGQTFTTDKLGKAIDQDEFLSFDGMSQGKTVIDSYADYAAIWGPGMNGFTNAKLSITETLAAEVEDDMAFWAGIVRVYGEMPGGNKLDVPGHMTLVFNKEGGTWLVMHEHMSMGVKR